jgi:hypothetical protein
MKPKSFRLAIEYALIKPITYSMVLWLLAKRILVDFKDFITGNWGEPIADCHDEFIEHHRNLGIPFDPDDNLRRPPKPVERPRIVYID